MSRLAEARAEYANLVASVQNHTRLVEAARKNLADARARQAGAHSASVISRIDGVEAGVRPAGPARKTIAAAGGVGGLIFGFGLIFLFANPSTVAIKPIPTCSQRCKQFRQNLWTRRTEPANETVRSRATCHGQRSLRHVSRHVACRRQSAP